jgi:cytosine/adenosine deaminase-related metal-dependent hydrolase
MFFYPSAITFLNAHLPHTDATTLRIVGDRIRAIGKPPQRGDTMIDLDGDWLLPGLINAHDHLELNNFPRLKWRERYVNSRDWIADFQPRFTTDPALAEAMSAPLNDRLFIGGLKNLLSGVTTVAHHNPLHRALRPKGFSRGVPFGACDFPVRVVQRYGWAHSLAVDGSSNVSASYRRTHKSWPWIIHLAEGTDDEARAELQRLYQLGCLKPNTLIVHGVGLSDSDHALLQALGGGLIWCPSSNLFMLGQTAEVRELAAHGCVALGSDSRLSGARDLLDELRIARVTGMVTDETLYNLVTADAARLLRLKDAGELRVGALADLLVMPKSQVPFRRDDGRAWARGDVRLVMIGGRARYADTRYANAFMASNTRAEPIPVDGVEKLLEGSLVARLKRCSIHEYGVML